MHHIKLREKSLRLHKSEDKSSISQGFKKKSLELENFKTESKTELNQNKIWSILQV